MDTFEKGKKKNGVIQKLFQCDACGKEFTTKAALNYHTNSTHRKKDVSCNICLKKFAHKCVLNIHIKTVHEGKKEKCELCNLSLIHI